MYLTLSKVEILKSKVCFSGNSPDICLGIYNQNLNVHSNTYKNEILVS